MLDIQTSIETGSPDPRTEYHLASMSERTALVFAVVLACLAPLLFADSEGTPDVGYWVLWTQNAEAFGIRDGYRANADFYPPLGVVILAAVAKVSSLLNLDLFTGFKVSLYAMLLLTSLVFLILTRNLLAACVLQLSLTINSMALGYIDIYIAPSFILSLLALKQGRIFLFSLCFAVTCLIKWQPLIIAPFLFLYVAELDTSSDWRRLRWGHLIRNLVFPAMSIFAICLFVFGGEMFLALNRAGSSGLVSNALNLHWIVTHWLHVFQPDRFGPLEWGVSKYIVTSDWRILLLPKLVFFATYILILYAFLREEKTFNTLLQYCLIGYFCYFTLNTVVHENHLFLATILAIALAAMDRIHWSTALCFIVIDNLNLLTFYGLDGQGLPYSRVVGVDVALPFSIASVLLFLVMFKAVIDQVRKRRVI